MEFLKENWFTILMLTPITLNVMYMVYLIIRREYFEKH
jgi:hypothetical protein